MKNGDKPSSPCLMLQIGEDTYRAAKPGELNQYLIPCEGLTKREHFAALAMQGLCATDFGLHANRESVAKTAVEIADALLKELEK